MGLTPSANTRRLLVMTYHFPPDGAIGGQRWAGLSKYLARLGWDVHVITAAAGADASPPTPGVHRHVRTRRRTLNDAYKAAAARFRRNGNGDSHVGAPPPDPQRTSLGRAAAVVRRFGSRLLFLPDEGRGWVFAAASVARGLLREQKFDAVITSGPPHSVHFAGVIGTRGADTQLWIDLRDPWSATHAMSAPEDWFVRTERSALRMLERVVFPRATKLTVNTPQFATALKALEPDLDIRCLLNGVDPEQVSSRDVNGVEPGTVSYVGTLYAGRNLSTVCAAIQALLRERPEAGAALRLDVAGAIDPPHRRQLENDIAAAGLSSLVRLHGAIPRDGALSLLARSHLSLVLAQGQPLQVPAKLYESVALGVPTLVIAEATSASACEARRIGAMTVEVGDVDGVRALLAEMLDGHIPRSIEAKVPITYAHLAAEWDSLLRESTSGKSHGTDTRFATASA